MLASPPKLPFVSAPLQPEALAAYRHATPYLLMDLDAVAHAYRDFIEHFPGVRVRYAVKSNPDRQILRRLIDEGSGFEVASYPELATLMELGVQPADVLFTNPVKPPKHIRQAHLAGLDRFSFDSEAELVKLATEAPGARVFVRLATNPARSLVASEGKFGVHATQAAGLMARAKQLGLKPYGIAFHVGSQMTDPAAWEMAIRDAGALMRRLHTRQGITLKMLDMGGGFPAHYRTAVPALAKYGQAIMTAVKRHVPYKVELVVEPGRGLVGSAGVMVSSVIGLADRGTHRWVHLDVGAFNGMMEELEMQNHLPLLLSDSRGSATTQLVNLTGPSCDSQDSILFDTKLSSELAMGDRVYLYTAGAYTTSYASRFNGFDIPKVHVARPSV